MVVSDWVAGGLKRGIRRVPGVGDFVEWRAGSGSGIWWNLWNYGAFLRSEAVNQRKRRDEGG